MIVQEPIQAAIWHCLNHYAYTDAVFLSERLYAEVKSEESLYILATSYYRSGLKNHAYFVLKKHPTSSPQCRFLFANCALELEKYSEAEIAICGSCGSENSQRTLDDIALDFGEQASFVFQILAQICIKTERRARAAEVLKKALKINPFLWSSFVELCNRGEKPDANRLFQTSGLDNFTNCCQTPNIESTVLVTPVQEQLTVTPTPGAVLQSSLNTKICTPEESPLVNPLVLTGVGPLGGTRVKPLRYRSILSSASAISPLTPSFGMLHLDMVSGTSPSPGDYYGTPTMLTEANDQKSLAKRVRAHVGQLIRSKDSPLQNSKPVFSQSSNMTVGTGLTSHPNVRRSSRLFSNSSYSVKENNKSPNRNGNNKFTSPKSPSRKGSKRAAKSNLNKNELNARSRADRIETVTSAALSNGGVTLQKQSVEGLMQLMRCLGQAYLHLAQFECRQAVERLATLPPQHYTTTYVQCLLGLAHFEMAEYEQCAEVFAQVHRREPHRLQCMETYSTALWHLQREVTLSALAQDLMNIDKHSAVTWCVAGNCFSLHKEHDTAIKYFQRAVQVDPAFPYAYTLLGHEYIVTEELDKAMSSFRNAVRLDPRHYNAWFGIGTVYSKQERYHLAEINYLRALSVNTHSSVIMCHIGVVQHALNKFERALRTLDMAIEQNPKNPLCKFHRGQMYFNLGRHAEALRELEELKEIVPKESLVYYLIGKVHKKLGNTDLALMHFSWATDLDPKGASTQIKEAFDPAAMARAPRSHDDSSPASAADDYPASEAGPNTNDPSRDELAFSGLPEDSDDSL